jgi:hypothetical protein
MSEFSKARISHAAELVYQICDAADTATASPDEAQAELYSWLQGVVDAGDEQTLTKFMGQCGPQGSGTFSLARSMVRAVGSVCRIDGQACALFGIPLVLDSEHEFLLKAVESRQKIELALEEAKQLRFKSVRLCQFPVRRVAVENMSAWELGRLGRDLYRYADSKLLRPTTVGEGVDVLVWLGLFKMDEDDSAPFFDVRPGTALLGWRERTKQWLTEELSAYGVGRCDPMAPMRIHDAITATRLTQAKSEWIYARNKLQADSLSAKLASGRLVWTLANSKTGQEQAGELWVPDEKETLVVSALRSFAQKYALSLRKES